MKTAVVGMGVPATAALTSDKMLDSVTNPHK